MRNTDNRDQQDDFELEITDLSHEETRSIASALVDLGARFLSRIRSLDLKVTWQAREEDDEVALVKSAPIEVISRSG
jgi:hypothetical protein